MTDRHDLDFFTTYTDENGWEIGIPLSNMVTALGVWVSCQDKEPTVLQAMQSFNVTVDVVLKVVEDHPWLGMTSNGDEVMEATLFMDGL